MKKIAEFPNCIVATGAKAAGTMIITAPEELLSSLDGNMLDDNCLEEGRASLPQQAGVYFATVEIWYEQGYFEGYPAPGESDVDHRLSAVRKIEI